MPDDHDITVLLRQWHAGDHAAGEEIFRLLMPDLKRIAQRCLRRERPGHTLQSTELLSEGYMKLAEANPAIDWRDRGHFFAICTIKLRRFLIDYARKKPKLEFLSIEDLPEGIMAGRNRMEVRLAVDRLLDELEKEAPMACAVLVAKIYIGYDVKEIAKTFELSLRSAERYLHDGRKWLFARLSKI